MTTVASAKNPSIGSSSNAFSFQMLVPYFDSGLNFILEKIAAKAFGSMLDKYNALDKEFGKISVQNVTEFEKKLEKLICGEAGNITGKRDEMIADLMKTGIDIGGFILDEKTEGGLYGSDVAARNNGFKAELGEILRTMKFGTAPRAQPQPEGSTLVHAVKRVAQEVTQSPLMRTGVATMAGGVTTALVAAGSALASDGIGLGLLTVSLLAGTAAGGAIKSVTERLFGANVPPPSHAPEFQSKEERFANVSAAFLRLRACILKLDEYDKTNLSWQPLNDDPQVIGMKFVAKHELKAQIFNLATLGLIATVALGVLGIISFKTFLVGVVFYYTIRRIADLSLALSNIETRTVPVIPYIKVPTLQGAGQIVKRSLTYTAAYLANYGGIRTLNKSFEKLNPSSIGFNADGAKMAAGAGAVAAIAVFFVTPLGFVLSGLAAATVGTAAGATVAVAGLSTEGRKKFWEHLNIISPNGNDWTPNFLTIGNVVILKNSCVSWKYPISLGLDMALIRAGLKKEPVAPAAVPVAPAGGPPQSANTSGLRRRTTVQQ